MVLAPLTSAVVAVAVKVTDILGDECVIRLKV